VLRNDDLMANVLRLETISGVAHAIVANEVVEEVVAGKEK